MSSLPVVGFPFSSFDRFHFHFLVAQLIRICLFLSFDRFIALLDRTSLVVRILRSWVPTLNFPKKDHRPGFLSVCARFSFGPWRLVVPCGAREREFVLVLPCGALPKTKIPAGVVF